MSFTDRAVGGAIIGFGTMLVVLYAIDPERKNGPGLQYNWGAIGMTVAGSLLIGGTIGACVGAGVALLEK